MFEGHVRLRAVERGQVCAYPLDTRLAHMQPGTDRVAPTARTGRKLDLECLGGLRLQRMGVEHAPRRPAQGRVSPC